MIVTCLVGPVLGAPNKPNSKAAHKPNSQPRRNPKGVRDRAYVQPAKTEHVVVDADGMSDYVKPHAGAKAKAQSTKRNNRHLLFASTPAMTMPEYNYDAVGAFMCEDPAYSIEGVHFHPDFPPKEIIDQDYVRGLGFAKVPELYPEMYLPSGA